MVKFGIKKAVAEESLNIYIILSLSIIILLFFGEILCSSYLSIKSIKDNNVINNKNVLGYYNYDTDEIIILRENRTIAYKMTWIHENCHRQQNYKNRIYESLKGKFINEMECNIKELFFWNWNN